ncbi:unnamed protein product [marine sediment metagenome]|uniref:Uncharacterized protein n=1 Tax=marine sediment metagenome TaxID=412755 RepID=X1RIW2_9ZZZZ
MVQDKELGSDNLEKLRRALAGLDICQLALVLEFTEYLVRTQARIEAIEKAKRN